MTNTIAYSLRPYDFNEQLGYLTDNLYRELVTYSSLCINPNYSKHIVYISHREEYREEASGKLILVSEHGALTYEKIAIDRGINTNYLRLSRPKLIISLISLVFKVGLTNFENKLRTYENDIEIDHINFEGISTRIKSLKITRKPNSLSPIDMEKYILDDLNTSLFIDFEWHSKYSK